MTELRDRTDRLRSWTRASALGPVAMPTTITCLPGSEQPAMAVGAAYVDAHLPHDVLDDIADKLLKRARQTAGDHGVESVETFRHSGNAAERILEQAHESGVDTIVMGSRGLSRLEGMLTGSVSYIVTHMNTWRTFIGSRAFRTRPHEAPAEHCCPRRMTGSIPDFACLLDPDQGHPAQGLVTSWPW